MRLPTEEEIRAGKADAAARFGRDEVLLITSKAPIDFAGLYAPLDLDAYCSNADDAAQDGQTSLRNTARSRRVWPDAGAFEARLNQRPALAQKVMARLQERAGNVVGEPHVELLVDVMARNTPTSDDAALSILDPSKVPHIIPGLTYAAAKKMLDADTERELWAVTGPHAALSCVIATPEGDVWLAAKTAKHKALLETKRGIVMASLDFVKQAVVWCKTPIDALLNDLPALFVDLRSAYETIGGEDADTTAKSL